MLKDKDVLRPPSRRRRRALVLFSGGLDSSTIVHEMLTNGWDLDLLYVKANQNQVKIKAEGDAIYGMLHALEKEFPYNKITFLSMNISNEKNSIDPECRFGQTNHWIHAAMTFVRSHHECVVYGMLADDQHTVDIERMRTSWRVQGEICKDYEVPPLLFPFALHYKRNLLTDSPAVVLNNFWTCEAPLAVDKAGRKQSKYVPADIVEIKACKHCHPCWALAEAVGGIQDKERYGEVYRILQRRGLLQTQNLAKPSRVKKTNASTKQVQVTNPSWSKTP